MEKLTQQIFFTIALVLTPLLGDTPSPEVLSQIQEIHQSLSKTSSDYCPFGIPQYPEKTPIVAPTVKPQVTEAPKRSLKEILNAIPVHLINAKKNYFLSNGRIIHQGETLPVIYQNERHELRIEALTHNSITIQNLTTQETATKRMGLQAQKRKKKNTLPPGATAKDAPQPLVLETKRTRIKR